MQSHRRLILFCFAAAALRFAHAAPPPESRYVWLNQPAERMVEATPLGNGRLGASIYGGPARERILLNESGMWSGSRSQSFEQLRREHVADYQRLFNRAVLQLGAPDPSSARKSAPERLAAFSGGAADPSLAVLLPALPKAWVEGSVRGLRARGGFEVDFDWSGNVLTNATIRSVDGKRTTVRYGNRSVDVDLRPGEAKPIAFSTSAKSL